MDDKLFLALLVKKEWTPTVLPEAPVRAKFCTAVVETLDANYFEHLSDARALLNAPLILRAELQKTLEYVWASPTVSSYFERTRSGMMLRTADLARQMDAQCRERFGAEYDAFKERFTERFDAYNRWQLGA